MKKLLSLALVMTLLLGVVAALPFSASASDGTTLDDHLISHWDFAGDNPLADKATNGNVSDTMVAGGSASVASGTAYIPDWQNQNLNHYFYVADSTDLMRTTENRTIYIKFMSSKGNFESDYESDGVTAKTDFIELIAQNGAMRVGINGDTSKLFGSTNAHSQAENGIDSTNIPVFVANVWTTVAISWQKNVETGEIVITANYKQGDSAWTTSTVTRTDTAQTWTQDDSDAGSTDPNYLSIGRRTFSTASSWGGNLTIDDIRIYDKALTPNEVQSIVVADRDISKYLVSHWDFIGSEPLADKAQNGAVKDTVVINGAATVANDGTITIPDWKNEHSSHYLSVANSADLMRTTEDRTIYMVFKTTKGDFANDGVTNNWIEMAGQNGAMRIGINADNNLYASTNSHTQGENAANSTGMNTYVANTWTTVAISWAKNVTTGQIIVTAAMKVGDGSWVTNTVTRTDTTQTWLEDNSDSGADDTEDLIFGRRSFAGYASTWGGDITFDDIRIYNCALNAMEIQSITISNDNNDPATPGTGDGSVTNKGHSLTLADDIGVNFYIEVADDAKTGATVEVTKGSDILYSGALADATADSNGRYKFTGNIAPKDMDATVTITVKNADGNDIYTNSYSAKAYIEYVLENKTEDTKLVTLVKAMANYGAYAQIKFYNKTEGLVNSMLEETERIPAEFTKQDLGKAKVNGASAIEGIKFLGATLSLDAETHIIFNFSVDGVSLTADNIDGEADFVYNAAKGNLQVKSKGLTVQNLATEQIVTITVDGKELKVAYSPLMYIMNTVDHADDNIANVVKALYAYYLAAVDYVS